MPASSRGSDRPWWQRRGPSGLMFVGVLLVLVVASLALWKSLSGVLPDVGKDQQGEDPWADPVGIEKVGQFRVAHIPDCAAAPIVRIELWNEASKPYWVVSGPPTPMDSFVIGITPKGWTEETKWHQPPSGSVLRLAVVRKVKGVAGIRYQSSDFSDLSKGYLIAGDPLGHYGVSDFQTGSVCGKKDEKGKSTTTTDLTG